MLLAFLLGLAHADPHVATFVTDPAYTKAPFAGLERLYVDPAITVGQVQPLAAKPAGEAIKDAPASRSLVFTNPLNQWGEMAVNGTKVGTIGPFATCRLEGFAGGWYLVDVEMSTGFTRHFSVQVL